MFEFPKRKEVDWAEIVIDDMIRGINNKLDQNGFKKLMLGEFKVREENEKRL